MPPKKFKPPYGDAEHPEPCPATRPHGAEGVLVRIEVLRSDWPECATAERASGFEAHGRRTQEISWSRGLPGSHR
jgi:hypothetical protein